MVQLKSIVTVILLTVLLSGCIGGKDTTPVPTSLATPAISPTSIPLATPLPEVTPTGNITLVKLDSRKGFIPAAQTIKAGDEIVWDNYDAETVTLVSNDGLFDARILAYGQQHRYIFKKTGTYGFYLENKTLNGTIIVEPGTVPVYTPPVTGPKELPANSLYVSARMKKPAYWEKEKYELRDFRVEVYNQRDIPISIKAQVTSGGQILVEKSFTLEREGSAYSFPNDRNYFINSTSVTLRLLIEGYQPAEYRFIEIG